MTLFGSMGTSSASTPNLWIAAGEGELNTVQQLIQSGQYDVNAKDDNGYSALHAASSYGQHDVLCWLLENGGDPNICDNDQDTPLHVCECQRCAEVLVTAGARIDATNQSGQLPIQTIAEEAANTHVVECMKQIHTRLGIQIPELPEDSAESESDSDEDLAERNL